METSLPLRCTGIDHEEVPLAILTCWIGELGTIEDCHQLRIG
jgi:hypothetical protein